MLIVFTSFKIIQGRQKKHNFRSLPLPKTIFNACFMHELFVLPVSGAPPMSPWTAVCDNYVMSGAVTVYNIVSLTGCLPPINLVVQKSCKICNMKCTIKIFLQ